MSPPIDVPLPDAFLREVISDPDRETYDVVHKAMAAEILRLRTQIDQANAKRIKEMIASLV